MQFRFNDFSPTWIYEKTEITKLIPINIHIAAFIFQSFGNPMALGTIANANSKYNNKEFMIVIIMCAVNTYRNVFIYLVIIPDTLLSVDIKIRYIIS